MAEETPNDPNALLRDWTDVNQGDLWLPVEGKQYRVPPVRAKVGAMLQIIAEAREDETLKRAATDALATLSAPIPDRLDIPSKHRFHYRILGSMYDELMEADAPWEAIERCVVTAVADFHYGRAMALSAWEVGRDPKELQAVIAATRAISSTL